jgi:hypothetical protein
MVNKERIQYLLDKYVAAEISAVEEEELFDAIGSGMYNELLSNHIMGRFHKPQEEDLNIDEQRAKEMIAKIKHAEKETANVIPIQKKHNYRRVWFAAASVLVVCLSAAALFLSKKNSAAELVAVKEEVKGEMFVNKENNGEKAERFQLEDGSFITLKPGSSVKYPEHFSADKRDVYLSGEAFFEITKNASKPFFVYNRNLVTHVLGTSFNIKTDEHNKKIEVSVVTGKVEVYERDDNADEIKQRKNKGLIITPNQKVIYEEENKTFDATLVDVPLPIAAYKDSVQVAPVKAPSAFIFESERFESIIKALQITYGVNIEVEDENINNCLFTGDITDQNLYKKLDILCQSLNDTYEVKGTSILIRGKGCK